MKIAPLHPWPDSIAQARLIQEQLRARVITHDDFATIRTVAGTDVGFEDQGKTTRAAVAVLAYPSLELLQSAVARMPTRFPYVPGYLSFREVPAILEALGQLTTLPDLLLCDGQGLAHPRRFGLACHLGVLTDIPAIGVAKSRLIGRHDDVGDEKGASCSLYDDGELVGAVLRSRKGVRPLYISIGHRLCLETAIHTVLACLTRYRLPETTRHAHKLASA
jgi:deoxyribonuclease V